METACRYDGTCESVDEGIVVQSYVLLVWTVVHVWYDVHQGLLDVLCFASKSRGDSEATLSALLVGLIRTSTALELDRRTDSLTRRQGSSGANVGMNGMGEVEWVDILLCPYF